MIVQSVSLYDQAPGTSMPYARTLMLVGQTGQGVTLMSDLLAEAVQLSGWKTRTQERFAACKKAGEVCSLLQLSSSGQFSAVAELSCDLILSWSAPSLVAQLQHLHPTGRALAWDAETRLATDSRLIFLSPTDCPPLLAACTKPIVLLGAASRLLPVEPLFWHEAFARHLPSKYQREAVQAFEWGCRLAPQLGNARQLASLPA